MIQNSQASPDSLPRFDMTILSEAFENDTLYISHILTITINQIPDRFKKIQALLEGGDYNRAYKEIHSAKGVFAQLGAERIVWYAHQMERAVQTSEVAGLTAQFEAFQAEYKALEAEMKAYLNAHH